MTRGDEHIVTFIRDKEKTTKEIAEDDLEKTTWSTFVPSGF